MKFGKGFRYLVIIATAVLGSQVCASGLVAVPDEPPASEFVLPAPDGRVHRLSDYRGRHVLVNFWATWCSPCIRELPSMQRSYDDLKARGFEILAIHVGPETPDMRALLERFGISFPVLVDADLSLGDWEVAVLPTSFLLDPGGRVIYRATGAIDWDDSQQRGLLERLLGNKTPAALPAAPRLSKQE